MTKRTYLTSAAILLVRDEQPFLVFRLFVLVEVEKIKKDETGSEKVKYSSTTKKNNKQNKWQHYIYSSPLNTLNHFI